MRHYPCMAALVSFALVFPARGDTQSKQPTLSEAPKLIEQLGDKDFHTRDAASRALAALGIDVLPALQKARTHSDPEVRRRLEELIPPLERTIALMPKRITLHADNKTIRDILADFAKQTGYKINTWPDGQVRGPKDKTVYTFHFDQLPFWKALDQVCEASGLVLQQSWGEDSLRLYAQDSYVPFTHYTGPFRVVATGFNYHRSNAFGQLPRNPLPQSQHNFESLQINLTIAVEPKLPLIRVGTVKLVTAQDEEGHSMIPVANTDGNEWGIRHYYGGYSRNFIQPTQAGLVWPSKTAKTLKSLKGIIPVTLLADQKPTVVSDNILAGKGKKFKVGQTTFHLEDVTKMGGKQYQLRMSVTEEGNQNDYSRMQSLQQRVEVQDEKGKKIPSYFNMMNMNGPSTAQFTITIQSPPPKIGPPAKLVYFAWVLMEHEVAFEFKDLPLP